MLLPTVQMFQLHVFGLCIVLGTRHVNAIASTDMMTSSLSGVCISNRRTQPGGQAVTTCAYRDVSKGTRCVLGHVQMLYHTNYVLARMVH